jgi:membrane dipeptidase
MPDPNHPTMSSDPLSRRRFVQVAAAAAIVPALPSDALLRGITAQLTPRSAGLQWPEYERAIVIDALASPGPFNVPVGRDRLTPDEVANARTSGITAINLTVSGGGPATGAFEAAVREIAKWERERALHPEVFTQVRTVADIRRAKAERKLGFIYGFQDAVAVEDDPSTRLPLFHDLGVRIVQLTYNRRNLLGDGCLEPANAGLSTLGHEIVERLNAMGVLVDLSHCGQRTTADGIAASTKPPAITHSGCMAIAEMPRNKRDEELRAMAEKGGVIGIYQMPFLVESGPPTQEDFLRHMDHALKVCGEDHVGVGSDLSITPLDATPEFRAQHRQAIETRRQRGISAPGEDPDVLAYVEDLNTPRRLERIADLLASRGHSAARIEKIIGGNWIRVLGEVWS